MAETYLVTIPGIDGGSTFAGYTDALQVDDYKFLTNTPVDVTAGVSGETTTSALELFLNSTSIDSLFGKIADGGSLKTSTSDTVTLDILSASSGNPVLETITLTNPVIFGYETGGGGDDTLVLGYQALTTTPYVNGAPGASVTITGTSQGIPDGPLDGAPTATGQGSSQSTYLSLSGITGSVTTAGYVGDLLVNAYGLDVTTTDEVGVVGTASMLPTLSPVTIDLGAPGSVGYTTYAELLKDAVNGTSISTVTLTNLVDVAGTTSVSESITLSDVFITQTTTASGDLTIALTYTAIELEDYSKGKLTSSTYYNSKPIAAVAPNADPIAQATSPGTLSDAQTGVSSPAITADATGSETYLVTIPGFDGGSTFAGYTDALQVDDYKFLTNTPVDVTAGVSGETTTSALELFLNSTSIDSLFGKIADGGSLKTSTSDTVTLDILSASSGNPVLETITLTNPVIFGYETGGGGDDTLVLGYQALTTTPYVNGAPGASVTITGTSQGIPDGPLDGAPTATGQGSSQSTYLSLSGITGSVTTAGYVGDLLVNAYGLDVTTTDEVGVVGTASMLPTLSPVTIDLGAPGSVGYTTYAELLKDAADGTSISTVTLENVKTVSGNTYVDEAVTLAKVFITASTTVSGDVQISLTYSAIQFRDYASPGATAIVTTYGNFPCFTTGTELSTTLGTVRVEELRLGDLLVLAGGGTAPAIWIGSRTINIRSHPCPEKVTPIRVRKDAFGPDVPCRDLLLSPDHAIYADNVLVPVKHLVNGVTILPSPCDSVTYYHVELADHDVLLAEGLAVESYLDTGNRCELEGSVVSLHPDFSRRVATQADSCAPLVVDGPVLAAVRAGLLEIALRQGFRSSDEVKLELLSGSRVCDGYYHGDGRYRFVLPEAVGELALLAAAGVPAEHDPYAEDRRRLGVAVTGLKLFWPGRACALPLDDAALGDGWHGVEQGWRWTDGRGRIVLDGSFAGARLLEVTVSAAHRHWLPCSTMLAQVA